MRKVFRTLIIFFLMTSSLSFASEAHKQLFTKLSAEEFILSRSFVKKLKKVFKLRKLVLLYNDQEKDSRRRFSFRERVFFKFTKKEEKIEELLQKELLLNKRIRKFFFADKYVHPYHMEAVKNYLLSSINQAQFVIDGKNIVTLLKQDFSSIALDLVNTVKILDLIFFKAQIVKSERYRKEINFALYKSLKTRTKFAIKKDKKELKTCGICFTDFEETESCLSCQHQFCSECLSSYIRVSLESESFPVSCPAVEEDGKKCEHQINCDEMSLLHLSSSELILWEAKQLEASFRARNELFYCATPDCLGKKLMDATESTQFKCDICNEQNCVLCHEQHHGTCENYKKFLVLKKKGQASLDYIEKHAQQCPHCRFKVSRVEGEGHCFKMKCPHCKKLWLWVVGQKVGRKWQGYSYHNSRKETFSEEELKKWEKRHGRYY